MPRGQLAQAQLAHFAIRDFLEYALARFAIATLRFTPLPVAHWLARCYTRLLDLALPRLRRVAYRNLSVALPDAEPDAIASGVFRSLARLLCPAKGMTRDQVDRLRALGRT